MWVMTRAWLDNIMNVQAGNGNDTTAIVDGSFEGLLKETHGPTVNNVFADISAKEADYQGYARQSIPTVAGPYVGQGGKSLVSNGAHLWQPTGDDTVNTIHGHFLLGADSATLLGIEMFDDPIPLPDALSGFNTTPIVGLDPNQNYGSSLVGN